MENNIIEIFYTAFAKKDWQTMQTCYHQDVIFEDPAFGKLRGDDARKMWKMLCEQGKDLELTYSQISCSENEGSAYWEAKYTFRRTGKKVHNNVSAKFVIKDGLISQHIDHFNLREWAGQALGLNGKLIGGTSFLKRN